MAAIRLYFDEDSARLSLMRELRARGVDLTTVQEAGMTQREDHEQLEWASTDGRAMFSFNRGDFYHLHTTWLTSGRSHSGIILSRQEFDVGEQIRRLLRLLSNVSAEQMVDRVEFLGSWRLSD